MNFLQKYALFLSFSAALFFGSSLPAASEDLIHVVGRGDTVYSISRFYSVSADELMKANNIQDPSRLQVGARLVIPALDAPVPAQALTDYRVVRGDTLYSIARNNGITLSRLLEINRLSSNHMLRAGEIVKVPAPAPVAAQAAAQNPPPAPAANVPSGLFALRWPIAPKNIAYMTGQMGVVIEGTANESVKCLMEGNVISAGPWRKFGRVVIIEAQGGYFYMYGGCEILTVNIGDRVLPGAEVGKIGVNAVSQKPELFFMVFKNDEPMDPAQAPRAGGNGRT